MNKTIDRPNQNTYWVNERFLAGEYPGNWDDDRAVERIQAYLASGVTYFIDLTSEADGVRSYQAILQRESDGQAVYQRYPIQDIGIPEDGFMLDILDTIDQAIAGGHVVYVHCWGGIGRTGTVVGCYLVRHGLGGAAALGKVEALFAMMEKSRRVLRSPETDEQMSYVRNWPTGK